MRGKQAFGLFQRAGAVFCGCLLTVFTGLVLYSVLMRYIFSAPPIWGEEMPRLLFVWMIFMGAAFAYFSGQNIRMTAIIEKVPARPRRAIELVMHGFVIIILLMILWYSPPILNLASRTESIATGISDWWKFIALPVGAILLLVNEVWRIARLLRGHVDDPVDLGADG
jgi:TRAP-type C4-dicarboxylate transport system permease small subunit